jgi:4-hydroxybenzoate polyprenyltransferase
LSQSGGVSGARVVVGAATWQLAILAVYLFNGVMDVSEDRVNHSGRPIARGSLDPRTALGVTLCAAALALAGSALLGGQFAWTVPAILVLGYLYSGPPFCLKARIFGTSMVASLGGMLTYYSGYLGNGGHLADATLPVFAVAMSLWMGLVGGLSKDFSDAAGDAAAGRRTAVVSYGPTRARIAVAVIAVALGATFLGVAAAGVPALLIPAAATALGATWVAVLSLAGRTTGDRQVLRRPYRAFMVTQYAVHVLLLSALAA